MATKIGKISVLLSVNGAKFSKGLKSAGASVVKFTKKVAAVGSKIAAIFGGVSFAAFALLVKQQLGLVDTLAKTSDALGITTEALAGFRLAGEITGLQIQDMDKALKDYVRRTGEAATGTGEALDAFEALGLSAIDLANAGTEEGFLRVVDALRLIPNVAQRADIAYGIFGRKGIALLNTVNLGRKGLERFTEEAKRMGVAISRVDAAKIEQANDSMKILQRAGTGVARVLTVQLAPFITAVSDRLRDMGNEGKTAGERIVSAFDFVVRAVGKTIDWVRRLELVWFDVQRAVLETQRFALSFAIEAGNIGRKITQALGLKGVQTLAEFGLRGLFGDLEQLSDTITALERRQRDFAASFDSTKAQDFFEGLKRGAQEAAEEVARRAKELREGTFTPLVEDMARAFKSIAAPKALFKGTTEAARKAQSARLNNIQSRVRQQTLAANQQQVTILQQVKMVLDRIQFNTRDDAFRPVGLEDPA